MERDAIGQEEKRVDSDETSTEELIRDQLGERFELHGLIGAGGMGQVFKALDLKLKRTVAIKSFNSRLLLKGDTLDRLRNEARIVAKLRHPNIVQIYDFIELPGRALMIIEYIEGNELKSIIDNAEYDEHQLLNTLVQVCDAVHYAHMQGIIHRDLKPNNIMITSEGECKVMDFGISSIDSKAEDTGLKGSPLYMAPELFANSMPSVVSDVYALGITMFYALTEHAPFSGMSTLELVAHICNGDAPKPSSVRPNISPDLDAICLKACSRDPNSRYSSATEMGNDIRRKLRGLPVTARTYSFMETIVKVSLYSPVSIFSSLIAVVVIFLGIYFSSDHVHVISEKTLLQSIRNKTSLISAGAGLAIPQAALSRLVDGETDKGELIADVDYPLAKLQSYDSELRDFYLLVPVNGNRGFRVIYARHGAGELNMVKIHKGHDAWNDGPVINTPQALQLIQKAWAGEVVVQEEVDDESYEDKADEKTNLGPDKAGEWDKRLLGYAPVQDKEGKPLAVLVVEISSSGIGRAYQKIEDAFHLTIGLGLLISLALIAGIYASFTLSWKAGRRLDTVTSEQ